MYGYIYKITNLINGKVYVGKKVSDHFVESYWGSGKRLPYVYAKYGLENFDRCILHECNSNDELNQAEKYWIKELNARDPEFGYNIAEGGEGGSLTANCEWFHNDEIETLIDLDIDIIPETFIKGRLNITSQTGTVWITNGIENHHYSLEKTLIFLDNNPDWYLGMAYRGDEWLANVTEGAKNRDNTNLRIAKKKFHEEHPHWCNSTTWKAGQEAHNKGKISVTNGEGNKYIFEKDLEMFLSNNKTYWRGNTQKHKRSKLDETNN